MFLGDSACHSQVFGIRGSSPRTGHEERLRRLSDLGDQLEAFSRVIDFEVFRAELEAALSRSDGAKGGRPPYDSVLMFKVLIIQTINNLSDERADDRISFMRFLGLG